MWRKIWNALDGWFVYLACFVAIGISTLGWQQSIGRIEAEGMERRDENCRTFESAHREEVTSLRRTYAYLLALPKDERRLSINQTIFRQLPAAEQDARVDYDEDGVIVPGYCDRPGYGLPEPDPEVPRRPESLRHL